MDVVLFGPPGAGKGTQAKRLVVTFRLAHISTGDILRGSIEAGSRLGLDAKRYMDRGVLVPDEVVVGIIQERVLSAGGEQGFVLDGFPRTVLQAEALDRMLSAQGRRVTDAVALEVTDRVVLERNTQRRSCPNCGATYHLVSAPPHSAGLCDLDGAVLVQRSDDQPEQILKRMREYREKTEPLKAFYRSVRVLREIDGDAEPERVFATLLGVLGR